MTNSERLSKQLTIKYVKAGVAAVENTLSPEGNDAIAVAHILTHAQAVVERISKLSPNNHEGRTGGVMVIARGGEKPFVAITQVGVVNSINPGAPDELDWNKLNKYALYALFKAGAILYNPDLQASALAEGLNINGEKLPAGGIKIGENLTMSFSGFFSGSDDEAVVLATIVDSGILDFNQSKAIAEQIGNTEYHNVGLSVIDPKNYKP